MNEEIARFMAVDYPFDIRVCEGFCPRCFKNGKTETIASPSESKLDSPTSKSEVKRKRFNLWMELFTDGGVDPIQVLHAYIPSLKENGRLINCAKFIRLILNLEKPGDVCKNEKLCSPKCLICYSDLDNSPTLSIDGWTVHEICSAPCGFIPDGAAKSACCVKHARTIPKFFEDNLKLSIRCPDHSPQAKPLPGKSTPAADKHARRPPLAPTSVHRDPPKQLPPKVQAKRKLLPIERVKERNNHSIAKMFGAEKRDTPEPKKHDPGEKRKSDWETSASTGHLGPAFLYGKSHGFDFAPPVRIPIPPSDGGAHQTNEDEAGAGAADGER